MAIIAITLLSVGFVAGLGLVWKLSQADPTPQEKRVPPEYEDQA